MAYPGLLPLRRMEKDHPLSQAARDVNDYASRHGVPATIDALGMDCDYDELAYLAQQRALRAFAGRKGYDLNGQDPARDERIAQEIIASDDWTEFRDLVIATWTDGVACGWQGRIRAAIPLVEPPVEGDSRQA